jgi:hypothetical protein
VSVVDPLLHSQCDFRVPVEELIATRRVLRFRRATSQMTHFSQLELSALLQICYKSVGSQQRSPAI